VKVEPTPTCDTSFCLAAVLPAERQLPTKTSAIGNVGLIIRINSKEGFKDVGFSSGLIPMPVSLTVTPTGHRLAVRTLA